MAELINTEVFITYFIPVPRRRRSHNAPCVLAALSAAVHIVILLRTLPTVPADLYMHSLALIPQKDHALCIFFSFFFFLFVSMLSISPHSSSLIYSLNGLYLSEGKVPLFPLHCDAYFSLLLQR